MRLVIIQRIIQNIYEGGKDSMYKSRIVDKYIDLKSEVFGAICIVGPKGCGKTTTALERCKTIFKFQDENVRENLLLTANTRPGYLLEGDKPILFDEWQDAPKMWGAVRTYCDEHPEQTGSFFLTGSSSMKPKTPHTGTLRISTVEMLPMSLFETGESNGSVSLKALFDHPEEFKDCKSDLSFDGLLYAICRGGWPRYLYAKSKASELLIAKDLYEQTYKEDVSNIDNKRRNPEIAKLILQSYARNISTTAETKTILGDVCSQYTISEVTLHNYLNALERLYIIDDIPAWSPSLRSKTVIRSGKKRNLIDPSIAAASLGASVESLKLDLKTTGFLFECLCARDLKAYSAYDNGRVSYYRDRYGLECDCVLHLEDGRYALIEYKMGTAYVDEGAKHLCELESLIRKHNEKDGNPKMKLPSLKIVITAEPYGYKRDDGVYVIPIGCLRN